MESVTVFRGDTPKFTFTLTYKDGSALDLTGYDSIKFAAKLKGAPAGDAPKFSADCAPVGATTTGVVDIRLTTTHTDTTGTYVGEVQVVYTNGNTSTMPHFTLIVVDDVIKT